MSLRSRAAGYLRDARSGFRRAPVEVLVTLCVAILFSIAMEIGGDALQAWIELAVPCFLILVVAWTGTLLEAMGVWTTRRRWIVTLVGVVLAGAYALFIADFEYEAEAWRALLLGGAAAMWLIALPAFAGPRGNRVERMRGIDSRILLRLIGALLYGAALFAGLALALAAVDSLFELELDGEIYGHVFGWIFFALVPWIVLGGLADYIRPLGQTNAVASVAQRIVTYLVPPLLAIYYLILFAYVARIVITGEVPKNLVSPLVLAAGGLSALALLLFDPRPGERGLGRWLRITPVLFLPIAALGFWAVLQRTDQYGLTEFRVIRFVVLTTMTLLALAGTLWLIKRRALPLYVVPVAFGAVALLFAVGPWSALELSRRSQHERLEHWLAEAGVPEDGAGYVVPSDTARREVSFAAYTGITTTAQYLVQHFGPEELPPVLRAQAHGESARWSEYAMLLGLRPDSVAMDVAHARRGGFLPFNTPIAVEAGTAYRITWNRYGGEPYPPTQEPTPIVTIVFIDSTRLSLRTPNALVYAELGPLLDRIVQQPTDREMTLPSVPIPLTDTAGTARGQLILWNLWLEPDSTDARRIGTFEGLAIVRE